MSSKSTRHTPASPPSSPSPQSKLPKFLQKQSSKGKSSADGNTSATASGSSAPTSPDPQSPGKPRKSSKFLGLNREDKGRRSSDAYASEFPVTQSPSGDMDEPPVIVEPVAIPRPRTRSERPSISAPESSSHHQFTNSSSTSRIGDLPTRLSGWFQHTFSTSSTDLSTLLNQSTSPKGKGPSPFLTAAKHGKRHLDKAMQYILDSDATPDNCTDPIWLLGVQHPGYEAPPPIDLHQTRRNSSTSPPSLRSSVSSVASSYDTSHSVSSKGKEVNPAANWPPVFYQDFTSRVWLTYRSQFSMPIRDMRLGDLCGDNWEEVASTPVTNKSRPWNWGGEKTWTSDSGWGCMLRTGQSLLANALVTVHLSREWRRPPYPVFTADYATYVQILTWFLDTPSPEAPFSVHRMALAGKEFGTHVGQWFGPSVAAGAIKTLVGQYPECGLGVSVASDGTLYRSQVYAASHGDIARSPRRRYTTSWGDRPVLLLVGIRLGIDGVNPIYYETIKRLYTFPQSVGIAGGRPSSSYYFVGSQSDNLFYLDPHHARPAIPLRLPPSSVQQRGSTPDRQTGSASRGPASPSSIRTGSSAFSVHVPVSPSPLAHQLSNDSGDSSSVDGRSPPPSYHGPHLGTGHGRWRSASASVGSPRLSSSELAAPMMEGASNLDAPQMHYCTAYSASELRTFHCDRVRKMPLGGLDPSMLLGFLVKDEQDWIDFRNRVADLPKTIFSVQEEPPSWPSDSDDNMGLESISEPDDFGLDDEEGEVIKKDSSDDGSSDDEEDDEGSQQFFDTQSGSSQSGRRSESKEGGSSQEDSRRAERRRRSRSEDMDTEDDPGPVTPGPASRFDVVDMPAIPARRTFKGTEDDFDTGFPKEDDIEDDWIDPSLPTPTPGDYAASSSTSSVDPLPPVTHSKSSRSKKSSSSTSKGHSSTTKRRSKKQIPVPVPKVEAYPFPVTGEEWAGADDAERPRNTSGKGQRKMHTARARDGGRTQSGGVKGIFTDD